MGVSLTRNDVFELLNSHDNLHKMAVTKKICHGFNYKLYAQDELEIAIEILRILSEKAETNIRATLSEALKLSDDLPHDIALTLAKDVEEVAIPMLQFSGVLTDSDLLDVIYSADVQKLIAITRREKLSHIVAKGLVEKDIEEVTESLLENREFINNKDEFELFIESCADNEIVMKRIIERASLPTTLSEKLLVEVSGNILQQIRAKYNITPAKLNKYVSHSLEISTLSVIDHKSRNEEIDYLVSHLFNYGRLTPSLVLSAACMGRKRFFISAIARRAGIPKANAIMLIEKGGQDGLHALLRKAGIPAKLFEVVELVLHLIDEKKKQEPDVEAKDFCAWLAEKLENFASKKSVEYISYMIAIAKQSQKMDMVDIY